MLSDHMGFEIKRGVEHDKFTRLTFLLWAREMCVVEVLLQVVVVEETVA
jgi:hypothetical protein